MNLSSLLCVVVLQCLDFNLSLLEKLNAVHRGGGTGDSSNIRHRVHYGKASQAELISMSLPSRWRIYDERNGTIFNHVGNVRPPLGDF